MLEFLQTDFCVQTVGRCRCGLRYRASKSRNARARHWHILTYPIFTVSPLVRPYTVNPETSAVNLGGSLVTMPSALVREMWDEKWQLSRRGPLYLKMWLRNLFLEHVKYSTCFFYNGLKIDYGRNTRKLKVRVVCLKCLFEVYSFLLNLYRIRQNWAFLDLFRIRRRSVPR
jgi:hypothetical protein